MDKRANLQSIISDIKIEPSGNQCKIIIELSWDDLERLMVQAQPWINPAKKLKQQRAATQAKAEKENKKIRRENLQLGKAIHEMAFQLRSEGLKSKDAWLETAEHFEIKVFDAKTFAKYYSIQADKERDDKICKGFATGLNTQKLSKKFKVSIATVYRVLERNGIDLQSERGAK